MNKERILELADLLESGPLELDGMKVTFDMEDWLDGKIVGRDPQTNVDQGELCDSVGCVAGWAVAKWGKPQDTIPCMLKVEGAKILGLLPNEATDLFQPKIFSPYWDATGVQVAKVLRRFAEIGEVDWTASGIDWPDAPKDE
jgi:hypothetical protein